MRLLPHIFLYFKIIFGQPQWQIQKSKIELIKKNMIKYVCMVSLGFESWAGGDDRIAGADKSTEILASYLIAPWKSFFPDYANKSLCVEASQGFNLAFVSPNSCVQVNYDSIEPSFNIIEYLEDVHYSQCKKCQGKPGIYFGTRQQPVTNIVIKHGMDTDKRVATPILFVYIFWLQKLRDIMQRYKNIKYWDCFRRVSVLVAS